jgi:glucosamine 6-phosphate synthetase-like amidotransferase/phosphosugar isomerase protein
LGRTDILEVSWLRDAQLDPFLPQHPDFDQLRKAHIAKQRQHRIGQYIRGRLVAVACEGDPEVTKIADHVIHVGVTHELLLPILKVVPLQMLAYHIAVRRGCDVDRPRNLAKSVTVE